MSDTLKGYLQQELKTAFKNEFGDYLYENDKLINALSTGVAKAVQTYLNQNVQTVVAAGPQPHVHTNLTAQ